MKIGKILILCAFVVAPGGAKALTLCQTMERCQQVCTSGTYCCPTGETGETKTCPTGWVLFQGLCTRGSTTGLSDSIGYYNQNYGTCSPTTSTTKCYRVSNEASVNIDGVPNRCGTCINLQEADNVKKIFYIFLYMCRV